MKPVQVIIADDNQDSIEIIEYFVSQLPDFRVAATCRDGSALVEEVRTKLPDLICVDINMPCLNGMDSVKECLKIKPDLNFIFITGHDEFALQAFDLSALDYIVKPIERTRLYIALERAKKTVRAAQQALEEKRREEAKSNMERLPVHSNGTVSYVPVKEIILVEKSEKKCLVYTKSKVYETFESIDDLREYLDADTFLQTDCSCIVNITKVSRIVPKDETYIIDFADIDHHARLTGSSIREVQDRVEHITKQL